MRWYILIYNNFFFFFFIKKKVKNLQQKEKIVGSKGYADSIYFDLSTVNASIINKSNIINDGLIAVINKYFL